jgi:uncharacterized protein
MVGRRTFLSSVTAALFAPVVATAQQMRVTIGTSSLEGGGYALYSSAFLDALKSVDPILEIRNVATKGSTENADLLENGDIDIGFVSGEQAHEIMSVDKPGAERLRVVSVMYSTPGMFAVRADSRFHSIGDLKGRPIVWNMRGSGVMVQAQYVMDALGLNMDRDFEPIYQEKFSDGPPLVLEGRAAAIWGSGYRWPGFITMTDTPTGARFIYPGAAEIRQIRAKYPFIARLTVPAGLYRGQYDAIETVGSWSFILARAGLPNAVGFRLAASLHLAERAGALTKQLAQTTVKNTLSAIPSVKDLQPGVAEYYEKAGLLK